MKSELNIKKIRSSLDVHKALKYVLIMIVALASLIVSFKAIDGVYVYSEQDIKVYAFDAFLYIASGGFSFFKALEYNQVWSSYPAGYPGIIAFFSVVLNISPERTATLLVPVIFWMLYLSIFLFVCTIFNDHLTAILSSILFFLTYFPMRFTWGGHPFILAFSITLALIVSLFKRSNYVVLGLLFGTIFSVYPPMILLVGVLTFSRFLIMTYRGSLRLDIFYIKKLFLILLVSSIPASYTLSQISFSELTRYGLISIDLGKTSDWVYGPWQGSMWHTSVTRDMLLKLPFSFGEVFEGIARWYDVGNKMGTPIRDLLIISSFLLIYYLFIAINDGHIKPQLVKFLKHDIFQSALWFFMLLLIEQINPNGLFSFLPFSTRLGELTDRIIFMTTLPVCAYIASCLSFSIRNLTCFAKSILSHRRRLLRMVSLLCATFLVILVVFSLMLILNNAFYCSRTFISSVHERSVISDDDYALMLWMKKNIPKNATVLVSRGGAGQFIPIIAHIKCIFPKGPNLDRSLRYHYIIETINRNPDDYYLLKFAKQFNITHIYIDAYCYYPYKTFNPSMLLNSSNYSLVKRMGNAWLFKVNYKVLVPVHDRVIADDNQTLFWTPNVWGGMDSNKPVLTDEKREIAIGENSLKISFKGDKFESWGILHIFNETQDWSHYRYLSIYWHGLNTNATVSIQIKMKDPRVYFTAEFKDSFQGWRKIEIPLKDFKAIGSPSLSEISRIDIHLDRAGTWYIDELELTVFSEHEREILGGYLENEN